MSSFHLDVHVAFFDIEGLVGDANCLSRDALKLSLLVKRRGGACPERHFVVLVVLPSQIANIDIATAFVIVPDVSIAIAIDITVTLLSLPSCCRAKVSLSISSWHSLSSPLLFSILESGTHASLIASTTL